MAISRQKKEVILTDLKKKFGDAIAVVFVKNNGLTMEEMMELRGKLREENVKFKVAKKTLMKLAIEDAKLPELDEAILDGPIGAAFSNDGQVVAAKVLATFAKDHEALELTGGYLDGKVMSRDEIVALSKLPTKQELLGQLVGTMNAPISGFHGTLASVLRGFVQVCDQVREKKEAEAPAAA